jgi:hypothetical protein
VNRLKKTPKKQACPLERNKITSYSHAKKEHNQKTREVCIVQTRTTVLQKVSMDDEDMCGLDMYRMAVRYAEGGGIDLSKENC